MQNGSFESMNELENSPKIVVVPDGPLPAPSSQPIRMDEAMPSANGKERKPVPVAAMETLTVANTMALQRAPVVLALAPSTGAEVCGRACRLYAVGRPGARPELVMTTPPRAASSDASKAHTRSRPTCR